MPYLESVEFVREFLARGGDVLVAIGFVTFCMWVLIFERAWYFWMVAPLAPPSRAMQPLAGALMPPPRTRLVPPSPASTHSLVSVMGLDINSSREIVQVPFRVTVPSGVAVATAVMRSVS